MAPQPTPDDLPVSPSDKMRDELASIIRRAFELGVQRANAEHRTAQQRTVTLVALAAFFIGLTLGVVL